MHKVWLVASQKFLRCMGFCGDLSTSKILATALLKCTEEEVASNGNILVKYKYLELIQYSIWVNVLSYFIPQTQTSFKSLDVDLLYKNKVKQKVVVKVVKLLKMYSTLWEMVNNKVKYT